MLTFSLLLTRVSTLFCSKLAILSIFPSVKELPSYGSGEFVSQQEHWIDKIVWAELVEWYRS
ncbi:hypothetical protein CSPX01_08690 [Colletotrichum filicis]|nr:hypothetical protein CSPX01_08690 [Colletotrichum filicis]